jgi:putative NADH-flavin reductase
VRRVVSEAIGAAGAIGADTVELVGRSFSVVAVAQPAAKVKTANAAGNNCEVEDFIKIMHRTSVLEVK